MEALGLERTDSNVCKKCRLRFLCYTNRSYYNGLCNPDNFDLSEDEIKQIHIEKAKKQGRYFPTEESTTDAG